MLWKGSKNEQIYKCNYRDGFSKSASLSTETPLSLFENKLCLIMTLGHVRFPNTELDRSEINYDKIVF